MKHRWTHGPLAMIAAGLFFSMMAVLVKKLSQTLPIFEVIFFRSAVSALIIFFAMVRFGIRIRGSNQKVLLIRSFSGFTAMCLNFFSISQIQLGDASVLQQSTPFFVILFSWVFLGESLHRSLLGLTLVCFTGIALVLRPSGELFNLGGMASLVGAIFAAGAYVSVRHLHKTDTFWSMAFYFMATAAFLSLPPLLVTWKTPNWEEGLMLLGTGIFGTLGQLLMTYAYKQDEASWVAPFAYAGVLFSFLWGALFFRETPGVFTLLGALLTVGGGIGILRLKKNSGLPIPPALPDTSPSKP